MYKHLLVPVDGSELSLAAVRAAAKFARALGATVTILNVQSHYPSALVGDIPESSLRKELETQYDSEASHILNTAIAEIERAGVDCKRIVGRSNKVWDAIITTAAAEHCDLVFMASHGHRGFAGLLIGSETHKVLTHCQIPVLVYR